MKLIILGASGHGKEVAAVIDAQTRSRSTVGQLEGFLDDRSALTGLSVEGVPVLGDLGAASSWPRPLGLILGVGYPETKAGILGRVGVEPFHWPTLVHPCASVGRAVEIEHGAFLQAGVVVTTSSRIGEFVTVNVGTTINHDCIVHRLATLSPGVHVGGNVEIGEGAFLGIGASVVQGIRIGAWSTVAAGAVVLEDVPPAATVVGVPARVIRTRQEVDAIRTPG